MFVKKSTSCTYSTPRFFFYLGLLTIGQTVFRPALSFTASDWFFLISFVLTTSEGFLRGDLEIKFPPYMIAGIFLFTVGGIVSSFFAEMPLMSFVSLIKYLYLIVIWFWLGTILLQTPAQIQTSIVLWTSSAALSGLGAIMQFFWDDIIPGTLPVWGRMTGFTEHVNDLGGLSSVALIPAIMMLIRTPKSVVLFVHSWICAILIFAGLVLSVSMTGVVALMVSLMVWLIASRFTLKTIIIISISILLIFTVIVVQNRYSGVSILSRFQEISSDGIALLTLQSRLDTYSEAWIAINENPLVGVGLGPDVGMTQTGHVVHNFLLLSWFESGLFGFLGIIMIISSIALKAYKGIMDPNRKHERILGVALFSSYIAFLVLGVAQPIYYKRFGWISASLLIALYSSYHKHRWI